MSVLVPVCVVWTAPVVWLRWCVGIVGVVLSGLVLTRAVWEGLKGDARSPLHEEEGKAVARKVAMAIVAVVVVMHVAIAMGFMVRHERKLIF